jgi:hypothetical protein
VQSDHRVEFFIIRDPVSLTLEQWDEVVAPDPVRLSAYQVASGFLAGIPFHFERNRDRLSITEQVDRVVRELEYLGYSREDSCYRFDFACWIPSERYSEARSGRIHQGHGVSGEQNLAIARESARKDAMEEAIREAFRVAYTERNEPLPGTIEGRITWYEITHEGRDPDSGDYVVDINAWIQITEE